MDRGLLSYILRRALQSIPLLIAVVVLNFLLVHMAPGDPVELLLRDVAEEELVQRLRSEYGLDQPLHVQLFKYSAAVLSGNLGYSIHYGRPVSELIWEHIPPTLLLMTASLVIASLMGIALGVLAAIRPFSMTDNLIAFVSLAGYSLPIFWFGQILVIVFSLQLDIFPSGGMTTVREEFTGWAHIKDVANHLVLPAICFASYNLALISRITRTSMLEVLRKDYVTTARSKGVAERVVVLKHMLRNALIPVVTVIGMSLGLMFAGSVLTETVFSWPGIGRLTYEAISTRDYPILMGLFIVISVAIVIGNLIADVLYSILDPRIRYE